MSKCGKGCMPECEYFTTGGCISPFNCIYKIESGYINSATSGTVIYTGGTEMKDFICKKCGNTTYTTQEKLNGTGKAIGLYCAKCGTWHKWLNKQEKVIYTTVDSDKDKEIARLTAENQRLKEEVAEQKSIAADEHATQMEWFRLACDYKAENAELRATLSKMETVEKELRARLEKAVEVKNENSRKKQQ